MSALILFLMMSLGTACPQEVRTGEILNVVTAGDGPAVVLLPGLSGCAYGYRQILVPLQAAGLRTVIIEPLGYGGSSRPRQADYSLTAQADRIAAVLDSLQLKDCLVVGHGLAASMALRLAYRRADLVAGIVSIEGAGAESAATPGVTGALKLGGLVAKLGGGRILRDKYAASLAKASGDPAWIDRRTLGRYLRNIDRDMSAFITAVKAMAAAKEPEALHANLGRIGCPVRLMIGTAPHDGRLDESDLAPLRQELPDFREIPVSGAGHFIFEEQPQAVVTQITALAESIGRAATTPDTAPEGASGNEEDLACAR
jgi:pimeloyl-ACP methyl ester carboxylesterase